MNEEAYDISKPAPTAEVRRRNIEYLQRKAAHLPTSSAHSASSSKPPLERARHTDHQTPAAADEEVAIRVSQRRGVPGGAEGLRALVGQIWSSSQGLNERANAVRGEARQYARATPTPVTGAGAGKQPEDSDTEEEADLLARPPRPSGSRPAALGAAVLRSEGREARCRSSSAAASASPAPAPAPVPEGSFTTVPPTAQGPQGRASTSRGLLGISRASSFADLGASRGNDPLAGPSRPSRSAAVPKSISDATNSSRPFFDGLRFRVALPDDSKCAIVRDALEKNGGEVVRVEDRSEADYCIVPLSR